MCVLPCAWLQAILAGSPALVDNVARIIIELVRFNPSAMVKLYLTGVFFFALAYTGSNWDSLADLLHDTHLCQSFHSDAANLTAESTLGRKSILGSILPESLVCVLANSGAKAFSETLLSNVDNPEVCTRVCLVPPLVVWQPLAPRLLLPVCACARVPRAAVGGVAAAGTMLVVAARHLASAPGCCAGHLEVQHARATGGPGDAAPR